MSPQPISAYSDRSRLGVVLVAALMLGAGTHSFAAPSDPKHTAVVERICGHVIPSCAQPSTFAMFLSVEPAIAVRIESIDTVHLEALRRVGNSLAFRMVCLDGHLTQKGKPFDNPRFVVSGPESVFPQEAEASPEWAHAGAVSPCEPGLTGATLTRNVRPNYPPGAMHAGIQGAVLLVGTITTDGVLADYRVIHSIPALDDQAIEAIQQWRFKPAIKDGKPVPMIATLEVTFKLK